MTPVDAAIEPGVSVWRHDGPFPPAMTFADSGTWRRVPKAEREQGLNGSLVIACGTLVAGFDSSSGSVSVYTRQGARLHRRGVVVPSPLATPVTYRIAEKDSRRGVRVEVLTGTANRQYAVRLTEDGLLEFIPGRMKTLTVGQGEACYGIVPSLIGVDLVIDPRKHAGTSEVFIPSMNLYTGLMRGNDCMMVGVWPPGDQVVQLGLAGKDAERMIERFRIDLAGRSFYLGYIEHSGIWRAEPLKDEYLETDTVIGWRRPFDAHWIGRFYVTGQEMHYPFYFHPKREKMWGRWMRGWYVFPLWFDGDKTVVHFEKKFAPDGELLIYYLEGRARTGKVASERSSPIALMRKALGDEATARLLDFEGTQPRPDLRHLAAVCWHGDRLGKIFVTGQEAKQRSTVEQLADNIHTFIRLIRERIDTFDVFAKAMRAFVAEASQEDPALAKAFVQVVARCSDIERKVKHVMPRKSLADVREWTDAMKALIDAPDTVRNKKERYVVLDSRCRGVAGTQDDLVRTLNVQATRLMEAAAKAGTASRKHVRLAGAVIARTRKLLRWPTRQEPRRMRIARPNPGDDGR